MKKHALFSLLLMIQSAALCAETNHAAQLKKLTEQRDNAVKEVIKPIDAKYHELVGNLQKSAAAANDFETVTAIQKILNSSKATPTMEDYFPAGSKWTGVWETSKLPEVKVKYAVMQSSQDRAMLEFENQFGKWKLGFHLRDGSIHVESVHGITIKDPPQFFDILISGLMAQKDGRKHLELSGKWKLKSPNMMAEEVPWVRFVIDERL